MSNDKQTFLGSEREDILSSVIKELSLDQSKYTIKLIIDRPGRLVYLLSNASTPEFVLKLSGYQYTQPQEVAQYYEQWDAIGIPVPKVVGLGKNKSCCYLSMEYVPGIDGDKTKPGTKTRNSAVQNLGQTIALLHENTVKNNSKNSKSTSYTELWIKNLRSSYSKYINDISEDNLISQNDHIKINTVLNSIDLRLVNISELHGDLNLQNIIINPDTGNINALIDPETIIGDPLYELAYFVQYTKREYEKLKDLSRDEREVKSNYEIKIFLYAYKKARNIELLPDTIALINKYEALILVEKIAYRKYYDPDNELPTVIQLFKNCLATCQL